MNVGKGIVIDINRYMSRLYPYNYILNVQVKRFYCCVIYQITAKNSIKGLQYFMFCIQEEDLSFPIICPFCKEVMKGKLGLIKHLSAKHPDNVENWRDIVGEAEKENKKKKVMTIVFIMSKLLILSCNECLYGFRRCLDFFYSCMNATAYTS